MTIGTIIIRIARDPVVQEATRRGAEYLSKKENRKKVTKVVKHPVKTTKKVLP